MSFSTIEMCAGAGGQALGLHQAGFAHNLLIEIDSYACKTLRYNNEHLQLGWGPVIEGDLKEFALNSAEKYSDKIDLVAGGVPCPPFSKAGKQLGHEDERDLFPTAIQIVEKVNPYAVMLENVPGLAESRFKYYRDKISGELTELGFTSSWKLLQSSQFGVPQLRPRVILVALKHDIFEHFKWPEPICENAPTVGETLLDLMSSNGWKGANDWASSANTIAPTLVGGSKKHGGPDLGPSRAKSQWQKLGVNPHRLANDNEIPSKDFKGALMRNGTIKEGFENMPLLTTRMAARIQGFPDYWEFTGSKTHAYRQVGNAFPPPVAKVVGRQIKLALQSSGVVSKACRKGEAA